MVRNPFKLRCINVNSEDFSEMETDEIKKVLSEIKVIKYLER